MRGSERFLRARGSAFEVGYALGTALGSRLGENIQLYLERGPGNLDGFDREALAHDAIPWLRRLPERFQAEVEGLAAGSGVPLHLLAEWCCADDYLPGGCTALLARIEGRVWVARNNDLWVPSLWGYATVKEIDGLIPTLGFGMEAEPYAATGINAERIWLHYNYLPVWGRPDTEVPALAPYVWLTTALETCAALDDVEALLRTTPRSGGMLLFAVDGKRDLAAIYECPREGFAKQTLADGWIAGANHYCLMPTPEAPADYAPNSVIRKPRVDQLMNEISVDLTSYRAPSLLRRILADPQIEGRDTDTGTVYSNVVCPSSGEMWHTFGGYPAASAGNWQRLPWPW